MNQSFFETKYTVPMLMRLAAQIWRKHWHHMLLIAAMFALPPLVIELFIPLRFSNAFWELTNAVMAQMENIMSADMGTLDSLLRSPLSKDATTYSLIKMMLMGLFMPLSIGACTHIAAQEVCGKPVNTPGMLEATVSRLWKYMFTALMLGGILAFFLWLLPLLSVFLFVLFAFFAQAVALTNRTGTAALMQSYYVVRGQWFRTFGFLIVVGVLCMLSQSVLLSMFAMTGLATILPVQMIMLVLTDALLAVFTILTSLWYMNRLAIRKITPPTLEA